MKCGPGVTAVTTTCPVCAQLSLVAPRPRQGGQSSSGQCCGERSSSARPQTAAGGPHNHSRAVQRVTPVSLGQDGALHGAGPDPRKGEVREVKAELPTWPGRECAASAGSSSCFWLPAAGPEPAVLRAGPREQGHSERGRGGCGNISEPHFPLVLSAEGERQHQGLKFSLGKSQVSLLFLVAVHPCVVEGLRDCWRPGQPQEGAGQELRWLRAVWGQPGAVCAPPRQASPQRGRQTAKNYHGLGFRTTSGLQKNI